MITLTRGGYIKRINPKTYKIQKRGGKGILGMKTLQDDVVEHFLSASTHDLLFFFTDSGKVFLTPVYEIPEGQRVSRGRGLLNFLEISPDEKVVCLISLSKPRMTTSAIPTRRDSFAERAEVALRGKEERRKYLIMATNKGLIKKTGLSEFENVRKSGLIAIKLKGEDLLEGVEKSSGEDEIILVTKKGKSIKFREKEVREMGRTAAGVKGIRLKKGDEVIGMDIVGVKPRQSEKEEYLLVVTENGYGKRTNLKEYRLQGRGGSGIKTAKVTPKTGDLIASKVLTGDEEDLIVISQKGLVIRTKVSQVSKSGRGTQGVRIMKLEKGDRVASATCI